jgi:hypothetical protein
MFVVRTIDFLCYCSSGITFLVLFLVNGEILEQDYADRNCENINRGNERLFPKTCEDGEHGSTISGCSTKDPYDSVKRDTAYIFNT